MPFGTLVRVFAAGALIFIGGWLYVHRPADVPTQPAQQGSVQPQNGGEQLPPSPVGEFGEGEVSTTPDSQNLNAPEDTMTPSNGPKVYSQAELLAMADNKYANGSVPLGDYKYVTSGPKKGYIYLCNVHKDNPGSMVNGPWMHGTTWNFLEKVSISGSVSWPNATFSNILGGTQRIIMGNDLPIDHTTGVFPVASSDPAHQYDANPNTISAQKVAENIPASPMYHSTPNCMGGEVGIMLTGVRLFNGFDAGLRDAAAHELQDSCDGHPQGSGEYHYHSLSACMKDTGETTVLGFAYDGFPITGPKVADGKYLTTEDLDECHGLTSKIMLDGKMQTTYHYVMTQDFPYSASCFRGTSSFKPTGGGQPQSQQGGGSVSSQGGQPPQAAIDACSGKSSGASCSVQTPNGTISGTCRTPPNSSLACIPN